MTYQYFNIIFVHAFKCRGSAKRQHLFCYNKQTLHRHQLIIMLSQNFHQPHLHLLLSVSNEDLLRCSMQKLCSCSLAFVLPLFGMDGWFMATTDDYLHLKCVIHNVIHNLIELDMSVVSVVLPYVKSILVNLPASA